MEIASDEDLLERVTTGDASATEIFATRFYPALVAYAFRLTGGDRQTADDIVQDALVKIITQRTYRPGSPAKPWIYRIVTNAAHDRFRRRARTESGDVAELEDGNPRPEDAAITGERAERVRDAVQGLGFEYRCVLVLRYYQDLSLAEIAAALDIPVGTVKSRLHTAINHLRDSSPLEVTA
jgi:RNA polymerase sigma factor (sigma-70 family)